MKKLLSTLAALMFLPALVFATPSSVDRVVDHIQPLIKSDYIKGQYFVATSTTASSTFANGIDISSGCFAVGGTCITGGGGGGTPGGADTEIQYNSAGAFAGSPDLIFNPTGNVYGGPSIDVGGSSGTGLINFTGANGGFFGVGAAGFPYYLIGEDSQSLGFDLGGASFNMFSNAGGGGMALYGGSGSSGTAQNGGGFAMSGGSGGDLPGTNGGGLDVYGGYNYSLGGHGGNVRFFSGGDSYGGGGNAGGYEGFLSFSNPSQSVGFEIFGAPYGKGITFWNRGVTGVFTDGRAALSTYYINDGVDKIFDFPNYSGVFVVSTSSTMVGTINATSTTASSTFANGIDLSDGCFAIGGVCITGGGASTFTPSSIDTLTNKTINSDTNYVDANSTHLKVLYNLGTSTVIGSPVYPTTWNAGNTAIEVSLARANSASTMPVIGLVEYATSDGTVGSIRTNGILNGVNTNAWSEGTALYVSASVAGTLTSTRPSGATEFVQRVATVIRQDAVNGIIEVSGLGNYVQNPNLLTVPGIGTSTFSGGIEASKIAAPYFIATSTTASSTFANGLNITTGCFSLNGTCYKSPTTYITLTSLTGTSPISYNSGTGAISFSGIATSSALTSGRVLYATGINTVASTATTTLTTSGALSFSQPVTIIGGSASALALDTSGAWSGNAGSATKLATARAINGVNFDGTGPITIFAASSTLLGDSNAFTGLNVFSRASTTLLTLNKTYDTANLPGVSGQVLSSTGTGVSWITNSPTLSGGSPNTLTYWTSASGISATSSPTVGYVTATTSTATSSFAGRVAIGGTTAYGVLDVYADPGITNIVMSDNSAASGNKHWAFDNDGGMLYLTRMSDAGATSTNSEFVFTPTGRFGIGTTSPYAALSVVGQIVGSYFTATSTTATSTFADDINYASSLYNGTKQVSSTLYSSFAYSTSTAWTGTTTLKLGIAYVNEVWVGAKCVTNTGTVNVSFLNGTNRLNMFNASTTIGTITFTTNTSFATNAIRSVDIGTPASSPVNITCTIAKYLI